MFDLTDGQREIAQKLDDLIRRRLFESQAWLAEGKVLETIERQLEEWGLRRSRYDEESEVLVIGMTEAGELFEVDTAALFLGITHEYDVVASFCHAGLITDKEADRFFEARWPPAYSPKQEEAQWETYLRPLAQTAYRRWRYARTT